MSEQEVKKLIMMEKEFEIRYEMSFTCFERVLKAILRSGYWSASELEPLLEDYRKWREIREKLKNLL